MSGKNQENNIPVSIVDDNGMLTITIPSKDHVGGFVSFFISTESFLHILSKVGFNGDHVTYFPR